MIALTASPVKRYGVKMKTNRRVLWSRSLDGYLPSHPFVDRASSELIGVVWRHFYAAIRVETTL